MANELFHQSNRRPLDVPWNYDRTELLADGVVHAIGLGLALVAVVFLLDLTLESTQGLKTASVLIYVAGLLAMLGLSAAYNMWPVICRGSGCSTPFRPLCHIFIDCSDVHGIHRADKRRNDHPRGLLLGIWSVAIVGIVVKLAFRGASIGIHRLLSTSRLGGMMARAGGFQPCRVGAGF
jgi:hemolysin III